METKEITLPSEDWLKEHTNSYRITTEGEVTEIVPKNSKTYTLEEMYEYCNTDIVEFVYLPDGRIMVCDEEGALKGTKRQNWIASKLVADAARMMGRHFEYYIYGNVMVIKDNEVE